MTWQDIYVLLCTRPRRHIVAVRKGSIGHPFREGAVLSLGLPAGQRSDWRFPADMASRGLHVQDFGDSWRAHLDLVHPDVDPLGHLLEDVLYDS